MSEYLDDIYNNSKVIRDTAYELDSLSRAFFATGNAVMGESLKFIAEDLMAATKGINDAISKDLSDRCQLSQKRAGETLSLVLNSVLDDSKEA